MVLTPNKIIIPITKEIVLLVGTNWILPVVAFHHISWIKNKNIKIYIFKGNATLTQSYRSVQLFGSQTTKLRFALERIIRI